MKKSELIQAIKEALIPEIEKIVKKRVNLAAAQIIKENRKSSKPAVEKTTTSLTSLMNEKSAPDPNEIRANDGYTKQTFIKGNDMLNDMLNETAQQAQEYKQMGAGEYTSDMAKNFRAANPMDAFGSGKPTAQQMIPDDRRGRDIPDALANALTKDYSALVKSPSFNKRAK
jgi:chromosomal replication initiation ATPase DnaA